MIESLNILVVEDDAALRDAVCFTLEMALGPWLYAACYLVGGIGAAVLAASGSGSRSRSISSAPWCWYIT